MKHVEEAEFSSSLAAHSPPLPPRSPVRDHLLRRQTVHHGDAPPLDVRPPLAGRRVGGALLAVGQCERGLQVAQRERPADGTVDVDAAGLGDRFSLAHVEPNELLDRVEAVRLQHVLHLRMKRRQISDCMTHEHVGCVVTQTGNSPSVRRRPRGLWIIWSNWLMVAGNRQPRRMNSSAEARRRTERDAAGRHLHQISRFPSLTREKIGLRRRRKDLDQPTQNGLYRH